MDTKLVIVGVRRSDGATVLISGPEVPYREQEEKFMQFRLNREHAEYSETNLCEVVAIRTERHALPVSTPKGKSPMKSLKHTLGLLAFLVLSLFIAPASNAQSYNYDYLLGGTANIAATSTNTTMSATNRTTAVFTKAPAYAAFQPTFKLTGSGTSPCVFTFETSVDGNTWAAAAFTISVTPAGTTTVANVSNQTIGSIGFVRLSGITNPNANAITNLVIHYSGKTP